METRVKLSKRNQITLPMWIRREYGLEKGDKVTFEKSDGEFVIRFIKKESELNLRGSRDK